MPNLDRETITPEELRSKFAYVPETGKIHRKLGDSMWTTLGKEAFCGLSQGYLRGSYKGVALAAHRVAWALHHGVWPADQIDHIDGDGCNNRISNLRDVTNLENSKNLGRSKIKVGPDSGVDGVYWHKQSGKWMARLKSNGKWIYLGTYADLDEAIAIRRRAEEAYGFHPNHGRRPTIKRRRPLSLFI